MTAYKMRISDWSSDVCSSDLNGRVDRYDTLRPDQVLLVKDFMLEDPEPPRNTSARAVDIPSPASGYVNSVRPYAGFVEIMDHEGEIGRASVRAKDCQ